jgi:hypothetical protein
MKSISITFSGYGHFKISINHNGYELSAITTNSRLVDDAKDGDQDAINDLYDEVVNNSNNINFK